MIEWIQHWDEMRFYYWSGLSWLILLPVYLIGAGLITLLWWWLAKRLSRSWIVIVPLYAVLAVAPWVEELWIAWNFGHLCKKDAGIFIKRTVEVEGFYDATAGLLEIYRPVPPNVAEYYEKGGFKFYELSLANTKGGPSRVVHYEKLKGQWTATALDHSTARYHYRVLASHKAVTHGVKKFENVVLDTQTGDVLGRYLNYYRSAPWFFVGLDRPTIPCRETEEATRKYGTISVYALALRPQGKP